VSPVAVKRACVARNAKLAIAKRVLGWPRRRWEDDIEVGVRGWTGSGSCSVVVLGVGGVEPSGSEN
jgi:hypothetical protein